VSEKCPRTSDDLRGADTEAANWVGWAGWAGFVGAPWARWAPNAHKGDVQRADRRMFRGLRSKRQNDQTQGRVLWVLRWNREPRFEILNF